MTEPLAAKVGLDAAVDLLGSQAAGRFQVIGYRRQKKAAETLLNLPLVQCWIDTDDVDWGRSSINSVKNKDVRIKIQYTVAQPASADIATLENPASTDAQRATALSNLTSPDFESTTALYNAYAAVSEILDDARNLRLGLPTKAVQDKKHDSFKQDEFLPRGGAAIITATSVLSFRINQSQLGDLGYEPDATIYDQTLQGAGNDEVVDTESKAGAISTNNFP